MKAEVIKLKIKVKRVDKNLPLPEYQHYGEDAGMDLMSVEDTIIKPGEFKLIKTGLEIAIPEGYAGFIYPRSGLALNNGITVLNADGVIDPGYRGEVGVILINHGHDQFEINRGNRIAQLLIHAVAAIEWNEVDSFRESERGSGGFGDSGI